METYTSFRATRKLGDLLKEAHLGEIPFTVRYGQHPACVGAPYPWFKRACHELEEWPELIRTPVVFSKMRAEFGRDCFRVVSEGAFFLITRASGPAMVLVPIPWYAKAVTAAGPPAREHPKLAQEWREEQRALLETDPGRSRT